MTICTPTPQTVHVVPRSRTPALRDRLLRRWWRTYSAFLRDQSSYGGYPPVAETYLSSMLARRLSLPAPWADRLKPEPPRSEGRQTLELLSGAETQRMQILKSRLSRTRSGYAAGQLAAAQSARVATTDL